MAGDSNGKGRRKTDSAVTAAWIAGVLGIIAIAVGVVLTHVLGGSPQARPTNTAISSPPAAASTSRQPTPQPTVVTYTVDPTKWAPAPVPGLTLMRGEVVSIKPISGQWVCATVAGPAGIQGNTHYKATYHSWAVPSAPFCSLIGKIGDGPWQELGQQPQLVANRSGTLALTVNELMPANCSQSPSSTSCYTDNEGSITIEITVR
jgi:hypothetical protein